MAKALAKSFPQMDRTVFDLPHVVDGLQGVDNLNYVGGDMFERIPPADAILLKVKCSLLLVNSFWIIPLFDLWLVLSYNNLT